MTGQVVYTPALHSPWTPLGAATELTRNPAPARRAGAAPAPFRPDPTLPDFGLHAHNAALAQAEFEQVERVRKAALARMEPVDPFADTLGNARQWAWQYPAADEQTNIPEGLRPGYRKPSDTNPPR